MIDLDIQEHIMIDLDMHVLHVVLECEHYDLL